MEHSRKQRSLAEGLGTALLVLVGPGSVVATLKLGGNAAFTGADLLGISFAFGLVIAALVYAIGKVSGNHINPAVTFALATTASSRGVRCRAYWAGQVVGATLGALAIVGVLGSQAHEVGLGWPRSTSGRRPARARDLRRVRRHVHPGVRDLRGIHHKAPGDFAGVAIGLVVVAASSWSSPPTAAAINPGPWFGPMLVLQAFGADRPLGAAAGVPGRRAVGRRGGRLAYTSWIARRLVERSISAVTDRCHRRWTRSWPSARRLSAKIDTGGRQR